MCWGGRGQAGIIDRHFKYFEGRASGSHLHLQRPAVRFFTHVQSLKRFATNGSKRTHIGRAHSVEQAHKEPHQVSGEYLVPVHASLLASPTRPRSDHEFMRAFNYSFYESIHHFRLIPSIPTKKNYYYAPRSNLPH